MENSKMERETMEISKDRSCQINDIMYLNKLSDEQILGLVGRVLNLDRDKKYSVERMPIYECVKIEEELCKNNRMRDVVKINDYAMWDLSLNLGLVNVDKHIKYVSELNKLLKDKEYTERCQSRFERVLHFSKKEVQIKEQKLLNARREFNYNTLLLDAFLSVKDDATTK